MTREWPLDDGKTRANSYWSIPPVALVGKASRSETVLFIYSNGPTQKPDQLIREPGVHDFKLKLNEAEGR